MTSAWYECPLCGEMVDIEGTEENCPSCGEVVLADVP